MTDAYTRLLAGEALFIGVTVDGREVSERLEISLADFVKNARGDLVSARDLALALTTEFSGKWAELSVYDSTSAAAAFDRVALPTRVGGWKERPVCFSEGNLIIRPPAE